MKRWSMVVLLLLSRAATAGTVNIGAIYAKVGAPCHLTSFVGVDDRVASYRKLMKEKFEPVDVAHVAALEKGDVRVQVAFISDTIECAADSGKPKRIVLSDDSDAVVLSIGLVAQRISVANKAGARFAPFEATGKVSKEALSKVFGKSLWFNLIYDGRPTYRDNWREEYAARILGPDDAR